MSNQIGLTHRSRLHSPVQTWACKTSSQRPMQPHSIKSIHPPAKLWCMLTLTPKLQTMIILSIAKTTRLLRVHIEGRGRQPQSKTWFTYLQVHQYKWEISSSTTQVGHKLYMVMVPEIPLRLERDRAKRGAGNAVARGSQSQKITNNRALPQKTSIITKSKTLGHLVFLKRWM